MLSTLILRSSDNCSQVMPDPPQRRALSLAVQVPMLWMLTLQLGFSVARGFGHMELVKKMLKRDGSSISVKNGGAEWYRQ